MFSSNASNIVNDLTRNSDTALREGETEFSKLNMALNGVEITTFFTYERCFLH